METVVVWITLDFYCLQPSALQPFGMTLQERYETPDQDAKARRFFEHSAEWGRQQGLPVASRAVD